MVLGVALQEVVCLHIFGFGRVEETGAGRVDVGCSWLALTECVRGHLCGE
mgnify:FL=1